MTKKYEMIIILSLLIVDLLVLKLSSQTISKYNHASIRTAGCVNSDNIKDFFSFSQFQIQSTSNVENVDSWDSMWLCNMLDTTISRSGIDFYNMLPGQTINTFPNARRLTNNKAHLCRYIHRAFPQTGGENIHMPCFVLPEHENKLNMAVSHNDDSRWIMKPEVGSGGRGLTLLGSTDIQKLLHQKNKHQRLHQPSIYVQKYLHNTFLLDYRLPSKNKIIKVKFDFRIYFAITNLQPLRVWIHRKGFSRLTTKEFSVTGSAATDLQRHVANIHFQTQYPESYTFTKSRFDDCRGSCRSLQCVLHEMSKRTGKSVNSIWNSIDDVLGKTGAAIQPAIQTEYSCNGCYQIWGADIVFDTNANPYLLEVNTSPSIERKNLLADGSILEMVYPDLWSMKGVDPTKSRATSKCNDWRDILYLLIDPGAVHKNGLLHTLLWMKASDAKGGEIDVIFAKAMEMITEYKYRGGFELGWPMDATVANKLANIESNKMDTNGETKDGSHLMTAKHAMIYEIYFQLVKNFDNVNNFCF